MANNKKQDANPFEFFQKMKAPDVDYEALMASHKKNLDVLAEAQKSALETMKTITALQSDFARQAMEDAGSQMKTLMTAKTVEERMQLANSGVKQGIERWLAHSRDIADHWSKTSKEINTHVSSCMNENMTEAQKAYAAAKKKAH